MVICMLCFACAAYNALYLSHSVVRKNIGSAMGTATVIGLITAGVLMLGFKSAW